MLPSDYVRLLQSEMPESGSTDVRFWERGPGATEGHCAGDPSWPQRFPAFLPGVVRLRSGGRKRSIRGRRLHRDGLLRPGDHRRRAAAGIRGPQADRPRRLDRSGHHGKSCAGDACQRSQADRAGLAASSSRSLSADDWTFIVSNSTGTGTRAACHNATRLYRLDLSGQGLPGLLTRLALPVIHGDVTALAATPDGRKVAYVTSACHLPFERVSVLGVINTATGQRKQWT